ncbi:MAG: hypothetical protein MUP49_05245 [Dehalococcoidia bacterium]|nr:hypothetical protein [Dehalococcoidia bacterium]
MLEDIYPVQFIEGLNHGEEPNTENFLDIGGYPIVAIEYKPKLSYCLVELEMLVTTFEASGARDFRVVLCPNYRDKPYDLALTGGRLAIKSHDEQSGTGTRIIANWQKVIFKPTAVVTSKNTYWILLHPNGQTLKLVTSIDGEPTNMVAHLGRRWQAESTFSGWKCMLRFYGRMVPVSV